MIQAHTDALAGLPDIEEKMQSADDAVRDILQSVRDEIGAQTTKESDEE